MGVWNRPLTLALPGEGQDLTLDISRDRLMKLIAEEITPIVTRSMSHRRLPRLKESTLKRKRRQGYPEQPLVATGALERSIEVRPKADGSLEVLCNGYVFYQNRRMFSAFLSAKEINAAVDRAIARWLETI